MSRASAKVYFKDWTILHWIYNWTVDYYVPKLYAATDNVREDFYKNYRDDIDVWYDWQFTWWEDCVLYDSYWGWSYYIGKASKECMTIHKDYLYPYTEDKSGRYIMKNISKEKAIEYLWYPIDESE